MILFMQFVGYLFVAYLFLAAFIYFRQESFLFFPPADKHLDHSLTRIQDYQLRRGDINLHGWLVNPSYARQKLLIYFGGNGEDVFLNHDEFEDLQAATLFVAYRGYGPSGGIPGEQELYADALVVIDDAIRKYRPDEVYLIGRSLGSGVACYGAAHKAVQGLILITPYDSIENVAKHIYPWLPVRLLLKHKFKATDYAAKIDCPVLVLYGGRDEVIRPERTQNLLRHFRSPIEVVLIEQAEHGTIEMFPEYWRALLTFISEAR